MQFKPGAAGVNCATEVDEPKEKSVRARHKVDQVYFVQKGITEEDLVFGAMRNDFEHAMLTMEESVTAKKGRKEVSLSELSIENKEQFTGPGGSDEKEWQAWLEFEAVEVLSVEASNGIRREGTAIIIPSRWVRTDKHEGILD